MKWIFSDDAPMSNQKGMQFKVSYTVQLAGVGCFLAGVVGTLDHPWITTFLLGGAVVFYAGKRMRDLWQW